MSAVIEGINAIIVFFETIFNLLLTVINDIISFVTFLIDSLSFINGFITELFGMNNSFNDIMLAMTLFVTVVIVSKVVKVVI